MHEAQVAKGFDIDAGGDEDEGAEEEGKMCSCRKTLEELQLSGIPKLSDRALAIIAAACPKLSVFDVSTDLNALDTSRATKVSHAAREFIFSMASRFHSEDAFGLAGGLGGDGGGGGGVLSGGATPMAMPTSWSRSGSGVFENNEPLSPLTGFVSSGVMKGFHPSSSSTTTTGPKNQPLSPPSASSSSSATSSDPFKSLKLMVGSNPLHKRIGGGGGGGTTAAGGQGSLISPLNSTISHNNLMSPFRKPVAIGKLVSLDLTGAPRVDDEAMMILFGGGKYQEHVNELPDYLLNKAQTNDTALLSPHRSSSPSQLNSPLHLSHGHQASFGKLDHLHENDFKLGTKQHHHHHHHHHHEQQQQQQGFAYSGGSMALRHLKIKWCNSLTDAGMAAALKLAAKNSEKGLLLETFDAQGYIFYNYVYINIYTYG
jgi:hypothetical protein